VSVHVEVGVCVDVGVGERFGVSEGVIVAVRVLLGCNVGVFCGAVGVAICRGAAGLQAPVNIKKITPSHRFRNKT